jgi:hypothetical protein
LATEYQLRQYVVKEGMWDQFLHIFPEVVAARTAAGFEVVGVWTAPEDRIFVWVVSTAHPDGIEGASDVYYRSELRRAIEPEPAKLLEVISTTTMSALEGF